MDALLLAVLNALWQGAALIALVALALRGGLRRNATTACVVWSLTFLVVALLPALDLTLARPATATAAAPKAEKLDAAVPFATLAAARTAVPPRATSAATEVVRAPQPNAGGPAAATVSAIQHVRDGVVRVGGAATVFARAWGVAVVGTWALVAAVLLLRLTRAYAAIARLKRAATPLDDPAVEARLRAAGHRRRASVACSPHVAIPCAVGFRHPMILVPAALAASLDLDDLARIVLHESAHLQRYDDWVNALEQIVCALQFFQPALYVARRSIDFEREVACDDHVLEDAGEPLRYAECLARIVQRQVRGPRAAVVPGFVLRRAQVVARVRRIVDRSRDASPHLRLGALALGGGVLVATLGIARLQVPVVAPVDAMPVHHTTSTVYASPLRHTTKTTTTTVALTTATQRVDGAPRAADPAPAPPPAGAEQPAKARRPGHRAAPRAPHAAHARIQRAALPRADHADHAAAAALAAEAARAAAAESAPTAVAAEAAHDALAESAHFAAAARAARAAQAVEASRFAVAAVTSDAAARAAANAAARTSFAHAFAAASAAAAGAPRPTESGASTPHNGSDLLDAIDAAKYPHPSVDELIALRNQGVTGDYVRRMGALGRGRPQLHQLVALAVQGITPDYVAALDRRLAAQTSLDQVIALRVQGVSAAWLDGLGAIGYQKLSADEAASLAVQGVSVAYVRGLLEAGLRSVTPAQLAALRVQGVDGTFVRRLAAHGYRNLSPDELARLKVSGFEP